MKHRKIILGLICLILFIIPFFWLKPGEMDLGGDSTRLYFYDPLNYFKNLALYAVTPVALIDNNAPHYLLIPFNIVLIFLKQLFHSSYFILSLFHSLHLVVGFICIYGITKILLTGKQVEKENVLNIELASILSGLCYIFLPLMVFHNWNRADLVHSYVFINPLMFFLLLQYFRLRNNLYLFTALLLSFIFAFNFSWFAAPYVVSFFFYTFVFFLIYIFFIQKIKINIKELFFAFCGFFILHAFHLLPFLYSLFIEGGNAQTKAFSESSKIGSVIFFRGIGTGIQLIQNVLGLPQRLDVPFSPQLPYFIFPLVIVLGLFISARISVGRQRKATLLLLSALFIIVLFMTTANVSKIGVRFYESLFTIPSFSMFRSFYFKWLPVYGFSFALVVGVSVFYVFSFLKNKLARKILFSILILLLIVGSFSFIRGDIIRAPLYPQYKEQTKAAIKMDPNYEKMLNYIRNDPQQGRFFSVPYSDFYTPMISGTEGGVYYGPSLIPFLAGRTDINGQYTMFPFSFNFLKLIEKGDYKTIENLFSILNIQYVYYNSDEAIVKNFPDWPYRGDIRRLLSPDKKTMTGFLEKLPISKKANFGPNYHIYTINKNIFLPNIYVAKKLDFTLKKDDFEYFDGGWHIKSIFFQNTQNYERRTAFLVRDDQSKFSGKTADLKTPQISFTKVNPTRYLVHVKKSTDPFVLVFSEPFQAQWRLFLSENYSKQPVIASYFNGDIQETKPVGSWINNDTFSTWKKTPIASANHLRANGYANGWYITPSDVNNKSEYTLIIDYLPQRTFMVGLAISSIGIVVCIGLMGVLLWKKLKHKKTR